MSLVRVTRLLSTVRVPENEHQEVPIKGAGLDAEHARAIDFVGGVDGIDKRQSKHTLPLQVSVVNMSEGHVRIERQPRTRLESSVLTQRTFTRPAHSCVALMNHLIP